MGEGGDHVGIGSIALRTGAALGSDQAWLMLQVSLRRGNFYFLCFWISLLGLNRVQTACVYFSPGWLPCLCASR